LPRGICATVFADNIGHARHLVVSPKGVVFVNTWSGRYYGYDTPPAGGFLVALQYTKGDGHDAVGEDRTVVDAARDPIVIGPRLAEMPLKKRHPATQETHRSLDPAGSDQQGERAGEVNPAWASVDAAFVVGAASARGMPRGAVCAAS
jgi:hypothetical protein